MKKLFLLVFILSISLVNAQTEIQPKPHKNWYEPEDPETVFFGLSTYFPAGVYGKWHEGEVTDIEKIGNISETNFSEYGLSLGYYQAINREINYMITAGIGGVTLNNTVPFSPDSFRENGTSYKVTGELGYRFNQTIALFAKVSPYYLNLDIENRAYNDYLNKHFLVDFGFGLRVHLHNPNG